MRNFYFGWQMNMSDTKQSIYDALMRYYTKFGFPPKILLVSDQLEEVSVPAEMKLTIKVQRVPKNILMIGDDE